MEAKKKISRKNKFKGNPRKISKKEFNLLKDHIEELGDLAGVVYCQNNKAYVGGNQRSEVFNGSEIEIVKQYDTPTEHHTVAHGFINYNGEQYAYREVNYTKELFDKACIVANSDGGSFDWEILEKEWDSVSLGEWGLDMPGLEAKKEDVAEDDGFEIPNEDKVKTNIKLGDVIQIGDHKLMCGSSTENKTWAKLMGKELCDLVITDPPYNVAYTGKTKDALTIENDSMGDGDFYKFLLGFYTSLGDFTKEGGGWYVWHADSEGANFRKAMADAGLYVKQCLIWVKNSMVMGRQDYHWKHEPCLYGWKPGAAHNWYTDRKQTTVLEFDRPNRNAEHPTMKPIELIAYQVGNSSKKGDLVCDGFLGSGTTMVASHQLGRKCYGMELDPKYCQVIVDRMMQLDESLKVTVNGKKYKNPNK